MQHRWVFRTVPDEESVRTLSSVLNDLSAPLAQALVLRGIDSFESARQYFRPSIEHLHDPWLMQDMDRAVARIEQAKENGEHVVVYGDYDVDGVTATSMMSLFLKTLGISSSFWIPHRIQNGYGLCEAGIEAASERGAGLIVALDCGITATEEALYARKKGIDLIICDHHTPGDALPDAVAVLDPKRTGCPYPFKELSGCGVGFKLIQALVRRSGLPDEDAYAYLDLVAISTASDIVRLEGENRVLMVEGMKRIRSVPRAGLAMLARTAGIDLENLSMSQIVFGIGPRINAAGRLGDAERAVELLMSTEAADAARLAEELESANRQRKEMDRQTLREAERKAERQLSNDNQHGVVVHDANWHPGVVGIVASRLVDRFYRPSIMLTTVQGEVKGSARSIEGVNIYDALKACSSTLTAFGGHDYAAGLSLKPENLAAFKRQFNDVLGSLIKPDMLHPAIQVDASLKLEDIDRRFEAVLKQFAPFGPANSEPVFYAGSLELCRPPVRLGRDGAHVKFWVRQKEGGRNRFEVIGFGMHKHFDMLQASHKDGAPLEMVFSVIENRWNGVQTTQLKARDLRS